MAHRRGDVLKRGSSFVARDKELCAAAPPQRPACITGKALALVLSGAVL